MPKHEENLYLRNISRNLNTKLSEHGLAHSKLSIIINDIINQQENNGAFKK